MTTSAPNPNSQAPAGDPAPSDAPAANVPQAQGEPFSITKEAFEAAIASAAEAAVAKAKDSIFAEARRTFTAPKQTKPIAKPVDGDIPLATPQPDPIKLRGLDRALSKSGLANELSDTQYRRAEKAFVEESPDDVEGWVKDYFAGFKGSQTVNPVPVPATPKPINTPPASDRGAPAVQVPLHEADLVTMSESDRSALIREKGLPWFKGQLAKQLKGRAISTR